MENKGEILIFQSADNQTQIDVRMSEDTLWLSLNQISELFIRDKSVISRHIKNIFKSGELVRNSVVAKIATTASDENFRESYNNIFHIFVKLY